MVSGVCAATGSLKQGLSVAGGMAFAIKQNKGMQRVYTLLGGGEMAEGNIWEAAVGKRYFRGSVQHQYL